MLKTANIPHSQIAMRNRPMADNMATTQKTNTAYENDKNKMRITSTTRIKTEFFVEVEFSLKLQSKLLLHKLCSNTIQHAIKVSLKVNKKKNTINK